MALLMNALALGLVVAITSASRHADVKRQASQLGDKYDFIIAGGGTAGLTVADRLTEAFPDKTVLVVEYGDVEYAPGVFDPPTIVWGGPGPGASRWDFSSLPNPEVNNKSAAVFAGRVVGGSSAVNGMFFDRASRWDFAAWQALGSPEFDNSEIRWNWDAMFPYYKKSVTFTEPPADVVKKYNYTWDTAAYGGTTPIYASLPPFLWGDHFAVRAAWKDMGIWVSKECAGGDKEGLCWIPISEHPVTARRSHAGLGHYALVKESRPNYELLVKHQVVRVVYPHGTDCGPPLVEMRSVAADDSDRRFNVSAKAEVILSAGAFNTPAILQRSGIGPAAFLRSAGIPVVVDHPGVGSNLQDHTGPGISWNYIKPTHFPGPLPAAMLNATFAAAAAAAFFNQTPAAGPYTLAMSNSAIWVSLPNMTADYMRLIVDRIRATSSSPSSAASSYLPADLAAYPAIAAGYARQLSVLASVYYANPAAPSLESGFATGRSVRAALLHPLSRGTVRLNATDPLGEPVLDYRAATHPVDMAIHAVHVRYLRRMLATAAMRALGAVPETAPGEGLAGDDEELDGYIRGNMTLSFMHPCCTAAMMPWNKGGVVGVDLKVHGVEGLRVVDMSAIPMLPSSHLSSLAYALGEKAADIIVGEWKKKGAKGGDE